MSLIEFLYIFISIIAAIINLGLAVYILKRQRTAGVVPLSLFLMLITVWIAAQLLSLIHKDDAWLIFWVNVRFFPLAFIPYYWLLFSLQFFLQSTHISRKIIGLLAVIPIFTQIAVWTNSIHHLFIINYTTGMLGSFYLVTEWHWGPLFWVHTAYSYLSMLIGIILIIHAASRFLQLYRGQIIVLIGSVTIPILITFLHTFGILPINLDLTPLAFSLTGAALFINITKLGFTDIIPVGKEKLIEFMRDGMIMINQHYEILDINQAALSAFHSSLTSTLGKKIQDVFPFLPSPDIDEREIYEIEPHIGKGVKRFEIVTSPIQRNNTLSGWFIIIRDTTEMALVELAYRDIERRFNKVIMHSHEGIVLIDDSGKIVVWNKAIEQILNVKRAEMIGRYVWDIIPMFIKFHSIPTRNFADVVKEIRQGLSTGKSRIFNSPIEIRFDSANHEEYFVEFMIYPIKTGAGHYICFSGHDITEQIKARKALQEANDTLEAQVKARTSDLENLMNTLEQRIQDRTKDLSILYQISATANQIMDLEEMLSVCLHLILEALDASSGTIHLYNEEKQNLSLIAYANFEQPFLSSIQSLVIDHNIFGRVILHGHSITSPDLSYENCKMITFPKSPHGESFTYTGNLMQTKGKMIGVLSVFQPSSKHFSVEQIALLTTLSEQLGIVIENHKLQRNAETLAVMEERQRLARDLHDSVTQRLYSLMLYASAGKKAYENENEIKVKRHLEQIDENAQQALREMRLLIHELRPDILEKEGFMGALSHRLDFVEKRAGVDYELQLDGQLSLSKQEEVELFTIITEALNNSLKHANADKIIIKITSSDDHLRVEICDNGIGFDEETARKRNGLGIISMRERAEQIGGKFSIHSEPNSYTCVCVEIGSSTSKYLHEL